MKLFRRNASPYTWRQRLSGQARLLQQEEEISRLRALSSLFSSLDSPPLDHSHPLRAISLQVKERVGTNELGTQQMSFLEKIKRVEEVLSEREEENRKVFESYPLSEKDTENTKQKYTELQTSLRLINLQYYCKNLLEMKQSDQDALPLKVPPSHVKFIIDSFLLGTGAERVSGHLRMIGAGNLPFTQAVLQSTYYSILEPEVAIASEAAIKILESSKNHVKSLKKMAPIYLLDKLEVNVKSRCVFAWSDPKYRGYEPLDDDQVVLAEDIYKGSHYYFPEAASVGKHFIEKYISDQQMLFYDINENRTNLRYGVLFFIATCIVDNVIVAL